MRRCDIKGDYLSLSSWSMILFNVRLFQIQVSYLQYISNGVIKFTLKTQTHSNNMPRKTASNLFV